MTARRIAIVQPNYLPWRGYFDLINRVDLFLFLDDVQYTNRDWRNRNKVRLKTGGTTWLSVPVKASRDTPINAAMIDRSGDWAGKHMATLAHNYGKTPFYTDYAEALSEILHDDHVTIADLDVALTVQICRWLGITTQLRRASELGCSGVKDTHLIALTAQSGGTHYLSGPSARAYIQPALWEDAGITLEFMHYPRYPAYPQIADSFEPAVSVMDMLFMTGPDAPRYIWGTA